MSSRTKEIAASLSEEEWRALEELARAPGREHVLRGAAERFLSLGLAELSFGGLDLTVTGRQVLRALRGGGGILSH